MCVTATRRFLGRKAWTPEQDEALRADRDRMTVAEIAAATGRTVASILLRCRVLGIKKPTRWGRSFDDELARLNGEGISDAEIGRRLGMPRTTVGYRRRLLGLPERGRGPWANEAKRRGLRRSLDRRGMTCLAQVRIDSWRRLARERGWPEEINGRPVRRRHIEILDALWRFGPQTRRQLAGRLGLPFEGTRGTMTSKDEGGSYLAALRRAGLVLTLGRCVRGESPSKADRGGGVALYALEISVEKGGDDGERDPQELGGGVLAAGDADGAL